MRWAKGPNIVREVKGQKRLRFRIWARGSGPKLAGYSKNNQKTKAKKVVADTSWCMDLK